jgi:photosystem II protein
MVMTMSSRAVFGMASATKVGSSKALAGAPMKFAPLAPRVAVRPGVVAMAQKIKEQGDVRNKSGFKRLLSGTKYDDAPEEPLATSAFTRRREIYVGRLAMTGFFSCVLGELFTGKGALGQIGLYTGVDQFWVKAIVFGIVGFNFITALAPSSPTFSEENQRDIRKRPKGPIQDPTMNPIREPGEFFGIPGFRFGFTKKNELFTGRLAMLGFASELIGELNTGGKGPLGQLGLPLNLPLNPELAGFGLAVWVGFALVAALGGNFGQTEGDEDIY